MVKEVKSDDIKVLRSSTNRPKLSVREREKLRKSVEKIIRRNEKEEKERQWAEMENRLYEFGMYARA